MEKRWRTLSINIRRFRYYPGLFLLQSPLHFGNSATCQLKRCSCKRSRPSAKFYVGQNSTNKKCRWFFWKEDLQEKGMLMPMFPIVALIFQFWPWGSETTRSLSRSVDPSAFTKDDSLKRSLVSFPSVSPRASVPPEWSCGCDGGAGGPKPGLGSFSRLPFRDVAETFLVVNWWFWWTILVLEKDQKNTNQCGFSPLLVDEAMWETLKNHPN